MVEAAVAARPAAADIPPFGRLLKDSRAIQRVSQMELGLRANVSARHISFLETGRSRPTRSMVLQLARALDMPLRDQNLLLSAAGFASRFRQSALTEPEMAPVRRALDLMLQKHDPWPALVFDRRWMLVQTNTGGARLFAALFGNQAAALSEAPIGFLDLLIHNPIMRQVIENWDEIVAHSVARVRREADAGLAPDEVADTLHRAEADPEVRRALASHSDQEPGAPLVPVILNTGAVRLSFFTTITTFGTPQDITAQELRLEQFFPMDAETEAWFAT